MQSCEYIGKVLGVPASALKEMDSFMSSHFGKTGVLELVSEINEKRILGTLHAINSGSRYISHVRSALRSTIFTHEKQFLNLLSKFPGDDDFSRASYLAREISSARNGFFLKKEKAEEILRKNPPVGLLSFLNVGTIEDALVDNDIEEVISALRFVESDEWMHETFEKAYSSFTRDDFEEREIELKILGPKWADIGKKFSEKKHHNVSHLKEFGVIFLNPIKMDVPGKFIRDFALLLHYFHEIGFYSKLFVRYADKDDFSQKLISLLRGDVAEYTKAKNNEWLIVQRYLWKENPNDPRLFLPRVNPESLHWSRGERDFARFALEYDDFGAELWHDLDWIGGVFEEKGKEEIVSFDLEDNVMSFVSFMEGKEMFFTYHQREAMWAKIFSEYVGGEEEMENLLIKNFNSGKIIF